MEVATPLIFLAPPCPDCGQPCRHPLTMPTQSFTCSCGNYWDALDDGEEDDGICTCCGDACTAVESQPPPPTDEQIFGRECSACDGLGGFFDVQQGSEKDVGVQLKRVRCPDCNGTGRIGAAQNRWTCLGYELPPLCASPWHDEPHSYLSTCPQCSGRQHERRVPPLTVWKLCPGRTDIVASPEAWEAFVRQLRTRTKTTVLNGMHEDGLVLNRTFHLVDYAPEDAVAKQGKWTVTVTFEPEP
jgi:hypothetical protein